MTLLALSPHLASATEAVVELARYDQGERLEPCCPHERSETPESPDTPEGPDDPRDCSRTCRSCHCCLPVVCFDGALPRVGPAQVTPHERLALAPLGADLPAHTRSLFRPPAV
ncbi:MAG TPA: hypothetical protein PK095_11810 [Myxococcota bacterium]|nr:hypothetical protein [Myxococcota bacterium]